MIDGQHCISVGDSASRIAQALCEKEINVDIDKAITLGYLHDIGKIVIPDSILLKPSRLNDNEFKIIKQHYSIGYELLSKVNDFNEIANIIHFHHERVDGLGYPKGLKSNEIPLESKILAVADAFDSMTTNRI